MVFVFVCIKYLCLVSHICRWWPAEVSHPGHVPAKVRKLNPAVGEFPIRHFGSQNWAWLHKGRYAEFVLAAAP